MEAGKTKLSDKIIKLDLVDAMIQGADPKVSDEQSNQVGTLRLPDLRLLFRDVHGELHELPDRSAGPVSSRATALCWRPTPIVKELFLNAGKRIVELTKRYYEQDDASALPRNIASKAAFENAMTLDIATGRLHNIPFCTCWRRRREAEIDFTMSDIDKLSRKVPRLCKVAPSTQKYHMEDVHRAGGVLGILGEPGPRRAAESRGQKRPWPDAAADPGTVRCDGDPGRRGEKNVPAPARRASVPPRRSRKTAAGIPWMTIAPKAVSVLWNTLTARTARPVAVLYGNFAENGCIVKTAGVDDSILKFTGPAKVYESRDDAVEAIPRR